MKRGVDCAVHRHVSMVPQEDHHILPKAWGGKSDRNNMIRLCANGHGDVHYFLALLIRYNGEVPPLIARDFNKKVKLVASRGYDDIVPRDRTLIGVDDAEKIAHDTNQALVA